MNKKTKNLYKAVVAFAVALAFITPGMTVGAYLEKTMNKKDASMMVDEPLTNLQSLEMNSVKENKIEDVTYEAEVTIPEDKDIDDQDYIISPEVTREARNKVLREYGISDEIISSLTDEEAMKLRNSLTTSPERTPSPAGGTIDTIDWWPQENHDPENTAYTTSSAPDLYNASLLWKMNLNGRAEGANTVVDDKVLVHSRDTEPVYCLNATTGAEIWTYPAQLYGAPAIYEGKVYMTTGYILACVDLETGDIEWEMIDCNARTPPNVVNNRIYYGGYDNIFYCRRATDGNEIWNFTTDGQMWYGSPAVANGNVYFGSQDTKIYCLNANTGAHIWNYTTSDEADTSPTVIGDRLYASTGGLGGSVTICLNATNGDLIWSHSIGDAFGYRGLAYANGFIYCKELLTLYCLYSENGTEKWSYEYQPYGGCNGAGPSVTADGKVFIGKDTNFYGDPNVMCFDANTGAYLGGIACGEGELRGIPVIANEKIYVEGRDNNHVYCLGEVDHDITTVSIDSPVSGPEPGTFTPEVTLKNQGRCDETSVPVTMEITNIYRYLNQDFDSTIWPPAGWTEEEPDEWSQRDYQTISEPPEAFIRPITDLIGTVAYLQTPAVDTSAATQLTFQFNCKVEGFVPNQASAYVLIRSDSSQPWTDIAPWPNPLDGNTYGAELFEIDITSYIGTGTQVRFEYNGSNIGCIGWHVDDVSFATPGTTPEYVETSYIDILSKEVKSVTFPEWTPSDLYYVVDAYAELATDEVAWNDGINEVITFHYYDDLAILSIDSPVGGQGTVFTPEVEVANFGSFNMTDQPVNLKIGQPQPTFVDEDFSGAFPPIGWTEEETGEWMQNSGDTAGGEEPEAMLLTYLLNGDYSYLETEPVDTTSVSDLTLDFKSAIFDQNGGYDCSVLIRKDAAHLWIDITPWSNPISGNIWPNTYTMDISQYIGTGTQLRFEFEGNASNFNTWYLDDITILKVIPLEYDETINIDILTEEVITVEFPEWTPSYLTYDYFGSIDYDVTACTSVPDDEFPNNDCMAKVITLDFLNDIGIKSIADTVWEYFHYGYDNNGVGLNGGGTYEAAMRLTPDELEDYDNGKISGVKFYHHEASTHSGNIKIYDEGTSGSAGPLITSEPYTVTGAGWYEVLLSSPITIDAEKDIWVSVEVTHGSGEYPIGVDAGPAVDEKGDWIYINGGWEEIQYGGIDCNWCIETQIEENVEWEPGTYPVDAEISNYGTYDENNFNVNAKIWYIIGRDWILYYESDYMVTTVMEPGDELETVFYDVEFGAEDAGEYVLIITTELEGDDNTYNDQEALYFSVIVLDDTPPETTHEFVGTIGENDWYVTEVTMMLNAVDDYSGVDYTMYDLGDGEVEYETPVEIGDGEYEVTYYSVDNYGNEESVNGPYELKVDHTAPTISLTAEKTGAITWLLTADVSDETSGVAKVEFYVDGEYVGEATAEPFEYEYSGLGGNTASGIAYDEAGNSMISEEISPQNQGQSQALSQRMNAVTQELITQKQIVSIRK